jgi:hypothetical protein
VNHVFGPAGVLKVLLALIGLLLLGNIVSWSILLLTDYDYAGGLVPMFNFDRENGIPAFYSAATLLAGAVLALVIGGCHRRAGERWVAWSVLGCLFIFLSMDELFMIHERLMSPTRALLDARGVFRLAWVIPYGAAVIVIGALFLPFLLRLPRRTMFLLVIAGAVFVGGAIGMEMIGGPHMEAYGMNNAGYAFISTVEELMEKVGVAIFLYALLDYLTRQFGPVRVVLQADAPGQRVAVGRAGVTAP